MFDHHIQPLPTMTGLSKRAQYRLLGWTAFAIALAFGVIALFHWLATPGESSPQILPPGAFRASPDELAQLKIETVRYRADPGQISATGTISVDEDHSTPIVLPYSGQVGEVLVQAGQRVARGQPLLKIASSEFVEARNALFSAAAQRASAIAQLKSVSENEQRQAAIYQTAGGALKDFRQAQTDLVAAQSAVRSADAALGAARDKLALLGKSPAEVNRLEAAGEIAGIYAETTYHAPVSGIIAARNVAPGQYVSAGGDKPLLTIADLSRVWLIAQIAESDAASVHLGDPVDVTTPAYPGRIFHAVIDNVGAALDPTSHRLPVRATVANADFALKPDMFASFAIQRHRGSSAVLVPSAAVIHEGDTARVWVVGTGGLLYSRTVVVTDSVGGWDKIGSGLRPGERIVTAGAIFVNEAGIAA